MFSFLEILKIQFQGSSDNEDRIRRFPPQPRCIASNPAALKPLAPRQTVPQCPAADESKFFAA